MATTIEAGPADLHIKINPNTSWSRVFTVTDENSDPVDLSTETIVWEWTKIGSPHEVSETFSTATSGIAFVTDGTNGQFRITVDVDAIWDDNTEKVELWYTHTLFRQAGSAKDPMAEGTIKVAINA